MQYCTILQTVALNNNNNTHTAVRCVMLPEGVVGGVEWQPPRIAPVCVIKGHITGLNYLQVTTIVSIYMH